jgi:hypothetical protein
LPISHKKKIDNLNRCVSTKIIESVANNFPKNKASSTDEFTGEFYQTFKEETISIF